MSIMLKHPIIFQDDKKMFCKSKNIFIRFLNRTIYKVYNPLDIELLLKMPTEMPTLQMFDSGNELGIKYSF